MTWYHGTRRGFRRGGLLLPRSTHGGPATSAPAWRAPGRGKPKVLVIEPFGDIERDPEHSLAMDAWRGSWAKVRGVLTEPAVSEDAARAGWLY